MGYMDHNLKFLINTQLITLKALLEIKKMNEMKMMKNGTKDGKNQLNLQFYMEELLLSWPLEVFTKLIIGPEIYAKLYMKLLNF